MNPTQVTETCQELAWSLRERPPETVDELAHTLHDLREAKRALGDAEKDIEAHLAEAMGNEKVVVIEGFGTLERKASPVKPKWDVERLLPRIAALSRDEKLVNTTTGEIETDSDAAVRVLSKVASIAYWRVGELKARGLDAKEFRDQDDWRTTVRIIPSEA